MKLYSFNPEEELDGLIGFFTALHTLESESAQLTKKNIRSCFQQHRKKNGDIFPLDQLQNGYTYLQSKKLTPAISRETLSLLTKKPTRTQSGVAPITILTKPFPCPGKCIFCPSDIRMPKSYLSDEPGAQRAERNYFDPYLQTYNRLQALTNIGHTVDKAEVIVLGGTWSFYPESYQIWFIKEAFRALNDFGVKNACDEVEKTYKNLDDEYKKQAKKSLTNDPQENKETFNSFVIDGAEKHKSYNQTVSELYVAPEKIAGFDKYQTAEWDDLYVQQKLNESAQVRCVGLVIETRPDNISQEEVIRIRKLGCTKAQIGIQSLQDEVLTKNKRGHDVAATRTAFSLLRQAGFKIHAHWMANLYGSSVEADKNEYGKLFSDPDFCPDELKIYPCSLIESADLMRYYNEGLWKPYSHDELMNVITHALSMTPEYCRLTRIIRDIPSTDIVVGNKKTNFRQMAEAQMVAENALSVDIRAREIKSEVYDPQTVSERVVEYETSTSTERFIQIEAEVKKQKKLLGFVRLSLPKVRSFVSELADSAVIRELHVYGAVVALTNQSENAPQHRGFGKRLLALAIEDAKKKGFKKIAVISAIGTKEYYRKQGFIDGELYQYKNI